MPVYDHESLTKTIDYEDAIERLRDAIADVAICLGEPPDWQSVENAIQDAVDGAQLHYAAESGGLSDGYRVVIVNRPDRTL